MKIKRFLGLKVTHVLLCLLCPLVGLGGLGVELLRPGQRVLRLRLETLHLLLDGVHLGIASVAFASSSSAPSFVRILTGGCAYVCDIVKGGQVA